MFCLLCSAPACLAGSTGTPTDPPATTHGESSRFRSPEDGWFDASGFLDEAYGFIPVALPITEPALGYGAAGGLMFIDQPMGAASSGFGRPNITAVGGLATANGSWGAAAGDVRHWMDDRLQTLVGIGYASINLDFHGVGGNNTLQSNPLSYHLEPIGGLIRGKYRLGDSRWWVGAGYSAFLTRVRFDTPPGTPGQPTFERESIVAGLSPTISYDSRDTIFTPTRGTLAELTVGVFSSALGSDKDFQRVDLIGIHYIPLHSRLTLGLRADTQLSFGDMPFYLRPFLSFRGVEAMRYQGEHLLQGEAEVRWQCFKRFSLVGFVGGGSSWIDLDHFERSQSVMAGGGGIRYELARKYGLHMGIDVACGPDDPILYVQVGSAWMRP